MKNLTKILIAVAIVALLLCSVVVVIGASDTEYKGNITTLQSRYQTVVDAEANGEKAAKQAEKLAGVYEYLSRNPVNPDSDPGVDAEGNPNLSYSEIVSLLSAHSVRIGNLLYNEIDKAGKDTVKIRDAVNAVYDHLATCPPLDGEEGADELAAKIEARNAQELIKCYNDTLKLTDIVAKRTNLYGIYAQLDIHPVDESVAENASLLTNASGLAYDVALELYQTYLSIPTVCKGTVGGKCSHCNAVITVAPCEHVDEDDNLVCDVCKRPTYEKAHYFERYNEAHSLKRFITLCDITAGDESAALKSNVDKIVKDTEAEREEKRLALDAQADFDEYDFLDYYISRTFDEADRFKGTSESYLEGVFVGPHSDANTRYEETTDIYGNKYWNFYARGGVHTYAEPFTQKNYTLGLVYDFDILLSDDFENAYFEAREQGVDIKKLFTLSGTDGKDISVFNDIKRSNSGVKKTTVDGAIERGVWTRITVTYNHETRVGKLYINYEYVMDLEFADHFSFQGFRMNFGYGGTYSQEIGLDNYNIFQGTSYREFDRFFGMTDRQKFEYYVDYMLNERYTSLGRNSAYKKAKDLISNYRAPDGEEETDPYVIKFDGCDYNGDIRLPAMVENSKELAAMVAKLQKMEITSATINDLNAEIAKINEFVKANGELINKGDTSEGGYQDQMSIVYGIQEKMVAAENVVAFVDAIEKFQRATGLSTMTKYAQAAQDIYEAAEYDIAENAAFAAKDPVVLAFEKTLNGEDLLPEDEEYIDIFEYYSTVPAKLAARAEKENAKRINDCIGFIVSLDGYEKTKEFFAANSDYIARYMKIVRDIISSGEYDAAFEGVAESIAVFEELDLYFYKLLQQQHIAHITAQLDKYLGTESVIDKMGVCAVVREYIASSDIAIYNESMSEVMIEEIDDELGELEALVARYEVYTSELELQKDDYKNILERNTIYFINTIEQMETVLTYSELVPLFEKATAYYYGIDVEEEETQAAIEKYVSYREKLAALEENGAIFVGFAEALEDADALEGKEKQDATYTALVNCMKYAALTDLGVEGVAKANETYEAALAAYNAELGIVSAEISETAKVTCAVRSDYIATTVLAIIGKIFED